MQRILSIILATTALAVAAPVEQNSVTAQPLGKRFLPSSNCGLDMYATITSAPTGTGAAFLDVNHGGDNGVKSANPLWLNNGEQGKLISCSYGTGIFLSVDKMSNPPPGGRVALDPNTLADNVRATFKDCFGHDLDGSTSALPAFQYWGAGYNVLVAGHPC